LGLADAASADLTQALALDPTLKRLAAPLLKKYNLGAEASDPKAFRLQPWMVRGGFVGLAMLLVLVGLLGTQKARTLKAIKLTPRRRSRADDEPITSGDLAPGRMLGGGYRVARELGRGGMGVVYEAFDERLRRTVAIKRLLRDEQSTPDDAALFLREARIVAQLKHPNLAQIYDVTDETEPFLVFEYVDGETLDRVLSRAVVLTPAAARPLVAQISAALTYAHGRGVIHRDLKPSNVMVTAGGAVKVMDFGIAHQSRSTATRMTQTVASGTPPYMAPEQAMGSVSKASDLYALGVMTYELLTGRRPFDGPDYLGPKLEKRYAPATQVNPALPAALDPFFAAALDPDPTKRPADAAAFMEAFGRACDATPRRQASAA
ncbi:MAG TPA: serine/threonine-protein kinase, partial [Elusimicrobiota bacterium]|nr:serine/threonine-protein kinase [Elusimicrobiota bacterium]